MNVRKIATVLAAAAVLAGCASSASAGTPSPGHCAYRDHGQLPDPRCTPGAVNPAVTQADIYSTICRKWYTRTVRQPEAVTERFKYGIAYPAYGLPDGQRTVLDDL